ncbi:MAG: CIA30 family protein [Pseudomonadota bacterium]
MFRTPLAVLLAGAVLALITALSVQAQETGDEMNDPRLLLDDFESADGVSALGTSWQGFTDRVMGGLSNMQSGYRAVDGETVLYMSGEVRLENNGGFVQVRLPLAQRGSFDASDWDAIRLTVRAAPGPYYIHLRTRDSRRPWAYYRAPISVSEDWQTVDVPFDTFQRESLWAPLDLESLVSLGIVAYGERFDASLEVAELGLVRRK